MMKVIAFKCRPDEKIYFDVYGKEFNMEVTRIREYLDLDTASLTNGYEGISVTGSCNVKADVIDKLKENGVKFIASRSIGYDNIDISYAKSLGIKVSNAEYSPFSVANYTVMMLLMLVRKSCYIVARTHSMDYSISDMQGREMQNLTVGILGTGRIGKAVIKNLSGFGCRIIGYDPYPNEDIKKYMEYVELSELYKESDVISLHEKGCSIVDEKDGVYIDEKADVVIASAGGFPKDINFYQTIKTVTNSVEALKDGGALIVLSECSEGLGGDKDVQDMILNYDNQLDREKSLRERYSISKYVGYYMCEMSERFNFILVSSVIDKSLFDKTKVKVVNSLGDALKIAYKDNNSLKTTVMPYAPNTLPKLKR